jgi:hypothetical protein
LAVSSVIGCGPHPSWSASSASRNTCRSRRAEGELEHAEIDRRLSALAASSLVAPRLDAGYVLGLLVWAVVALEQWSSQRCWFLGASRQQMLRASPTRCVEAGPSPASSFLQARTGSIGRPPCLIQIKANPSVRWSFGTRIGLLHSISGLRVDFTVSSGATAHATETGDDRYRPQAVPAHAPCLARASSDLDE